VRGRLVAGVAPPGEAPVRDHEGGVVRFGDQARSVLALVGRAGGAERGKGGGVAAALGREVAPESEHVRPLSKPQRLEVGKLTQAQASADQSTRMLADGKRGELIGRRDPPVNGARAFGSLGGVLGDVSGDLGIRQLAGGGDDADVVLALRSRRYRDGATRHP